MGEGSSPAAADAAQPTQVDGETLVRLYAETLYRYAFRLCGGAADAEDLVQETFLDAHRSLAQLHTPEKPLPWLLVILRRRWIKWVRGRQAAATVALPNGVVDPGTETPSPTWDFDSQELQAALDRLPSEFREVLVLFYFRDLKYRDIAEVTETPLGTVMSRLARGKAALRRLLEGEPPKNLTERETRDGTP